MALGFGCCGCSGTISGGPCNCINGCGACSIAKHDLTLSYINLILGQGSVSLNYNGIFWETDCFNQLKAIFVCSSNNPTLKVFYFLSGSCPGGQSQSWESDRSPPFQLYLEQLNCVSGVFNSATYNTYQFASCPNLSTNGYTEFTVTDANPPDNLTDPTICFCITVWGCNLTPYPGATVSISGPNGSDTDITNDVGAACLVVKGGRGDYTVTISEPTGRFQVYTRTYTVNNNNCPFIDSVVLIPADGYICLTCCLIPIKTTLQFSMNCMFDWCADQGGKSFNATLTLMDGGFCGYPSPFGAPICAPCCSEGPPVCQPLICAIGCPGDICLPNTINFSCPPGYMLEFNCVNIDGSCADGNCTDCSIMGCLNSDDLTGYICCSYTITE